MRSLHFPFPVRKSSCRHQTGDIVVRDTVVGMCDARCYRFCVVLRRSDARFHRVCEGSILEAFFLLEIIYFVRASAGYEMRWMLRKFAFLSRSPIKGGVFLPVNVEPGISWSVCKNVSPKHKVKPFTLS